jgi:hypothetical protein
LATNISEVKITVPTTSTWVMQIHWHNSSDHVETIEHTAGAHWSLTQAIAVYGSSATKGASHSVREIKPGVRVSWQVDSHWYEYHDPPVTGWPDLEVSVRGDGYEELWRNIVSATLDKDLWPELASTPVVTRMLMKGIKAIPLFGHRLWKIVVDHVLKVQLLMIFGRYEYVIWCGYIPLTDWWPTPVLSDELAPEWVQKLEWRSAELFNKTATWAARMLGKTVLGLKDGYHEYCLPPTISLGHGKC